MKKIIIAAVMAGTALGGTALAAQQTPDVAAMAKHHRGHGQMFAKMDTNGDGAVTRAEAQAAAAARFARMDPNNDGQITADEIKAKHDAMRAKWAERRAARGSEAQPGEHSGKRHHGRRGHHGMMGKRMDADGNGTVTRQEAEAAALQRFDRMDANKDGKIDQAEIAQLHAQMKARFEAKRAQRSAAE